jgi:hypothetical protein
MARALSQLLKVILIWQLSSLTGCVWISHRLEVQKVDPGRKVRITTPVKAHLKDGSTVVYLTGVTVTPEFLDGPGDRYDIALAQSKVVRVPLDDVAGMESFVTKVNKTRSIVVSSLVSVGTVVGSVALFKAIFGSCPTVYSNDGTVEEAELFSSSIAPLLESRDLDRLQAQPGPDGILRLELRNEAMETHYINHLQLLEIQHASDELVLPDDQGRPLIVGTLRPPASVLDRAGRDVRGTVLNADGQAFMTDQQTLDSVRTTSMDDWLDLAVPVPQGSTSVALVVRARNSLLNTVLLYDVMLQRSGARAIEWLGSDLSRISNVVQLGRWYQQRSGLHVSVWRQGQYEEVARLPDSGPIFWHDAAAVIPVKAGETNLRLRLSFVSDQWRIDQIRFAAVARETTPRLIDVMDVTDAGRNVERAARERIRASDDQYFQTLPGQRFLVDFNVGSVSAGVSRTFLISSQGYYIEWIRGAWIRSAASNKPFVPDDEALLAAIHKWRSIRESFEREFMSARVPVN